MISLSILFFFFHLYVCRRFNVMMEDFFYVMSFIFVWPFGMPWAWKILSFCRQEKKKKFKAWKLRFRVGSYFYLSPKWSLKILIIMSICLRNSLYVDTVTVDIIEKNGFWINIGQWKTLNVITVGRTIGKG